MTADEFVERYRRLAPSVEEMVEAGSCVEVAEELVSGYMALPKATCEAPRNTDPLLDLIERFDTRTLYVCGLQFDQKGLDFSRDRIAPSGRMDYSNHGMVFQALSVGLLFSTITKSALPDSSSCSSGGCNWTMRHSYSPAGNWIA